MSSEMAFIVIPCLAASSERSAVYKMKSRGLSTDPCVTGHVTVIVVDVIPAYTAWIVLPVRYDLNRDNASPLILKSRSSPCSNSSWSTMLNATVSSNKHTAEICSQLSRVAHYRPCRVLVNKI